MNHTSIFIYSTFKSLLRDRVIYSVLGIALVLLCLVPVFSLFSMRQVQELAITLSLSANSFVLLVITIVLGSSVIWRDIEKRYTISVLSLPLSRQSYVVGKFAGVAAFIAICGCVFGLIALAVISLTTAIYPSDIPVNLANVFAAIIADVLKYILLTAVAIFFSSLSTSFVLPFFGTIAIYIAGNATQNVYEYISGDLGSKISPVTAIVLKGIYYLLPNFAAFNLKVYAIYGLKMSMLDLCYTFFYWLIYTSLLLLISVKIFSRREFP